MNSYEFHIWGSKINNINKPDILVFDLDPGDGVGVAQIIRGAEDLKKILDELKLKSYIKTSGGKGYHIFIPVQMKSWSEARKISKNIAILMEQKWPNLYTSNMRKSTRKGKIFIDWVRNTKGSTSVTPYSIRLRKGASISMPIFWDEIYKYNPDEIKMEEALIMIEKEDPWKDFFD